MNNYKTALEAITHVLGTCKEPRHEATRMYNIAADALLAGEGSSVEEEIKRNRERIRRALEFLHPLLGPGCPEDVENAYHALLYPPVTDPNLPTICAWCRKSVHVRGEWVVPQSVDDSFPGSVHLFTHEVLRGPFSHGICPECEANSE